MASGTRELKRRMRSVRNIEQITTAMETVAATKMRRAQTRAVDGRPFAQHAYRLLRNIAHNLPATTHPLLQAQPTNHQLVVLISGDKGLAGPINANLFRKVGDFVSDQKSKQRQTSFVVVGRKAQNYAAKQGFDVKASYDAFADQFRVQDLEPITEYAIDQFSAGTYDKIILAYTNFVSTLKQEPIIRGILPLTFEKLEDLGDLSDEAQVTSIDDETAVDYLFEPDVAAVTQELIPQLVRMVIFHTTLEAIASEHSARMVAMQKASDSAQELNEKLLLSYNRARQDNITKELAEIVGGSSVTSN